MVKYHIKKDGTPGICRAKNKCPLGGPESHYESQELAEQAAQKQLESQFSSSIVENHSSTKNNKSYLTNTEREEDEFVKRKLNAIINKITNAGGEVYYVGGYVRDELLGRTSKDIDLEIHSISVDDTKKVLSELGTVDEVGVSFGVLKLKGVDIDIAFPRRDSKVGDKHTDFEVDVDPFMSVGEAARRRDFTMNSIMKNAATGEFVDPYNGVEDIKNKVIRMVDPSTFTDDNLRPLRACQFASRFNFTVDDKVIELSKTLDYTTLSKERVGGEMEKMLMSDTPSVGLEYMRQMGVLKQIAPDLDKLKDTEQDREWHPEGDVFAHTLGVMDAASKLKNESSDPMSFMYSAMLHDIGKPKVTEINEKTGKITAIAHAEAGGEMFKDTLSSFTKTKKHNKFVEFMVSKHMKAHHLLDMKPTKVRRLMANGPILDLALLSVADQYRGGNPTIEELKEKANFNEVIKRVRSFEQGAPYKIIPFYQGKDVLEFGFKPGPEIGKLLNEAFELQLTGHSKDHIARVLTNKAKEKESL